MLTSTMQTPNYEGAWAAFNKLPIENFRLSDLQNIVRVYHLPSHFHVGNCNGHVSRMDRYHQLRFKFEEYFAKFKEQGEQDLNPTHSTDYVKPTPNGDPEKPEAPQGPNDTQPDYMNAFTQLQNLTKYRLQDLRDIVSQNRLPYHVGNCNGTVSVEYRYNELKKWLNEWIINYSNENNSEEDDSDYVYQSDEDDDESAVGLVTEEPTSPMTDYSEMLIEIVNSMLSTSQFFDYYRYKEVLSLKKVEWMEQMATVIDLYWEMQNSTLETLPKRKDPFTQLLNIASINSTVRLILNKVKTERYKLDDVSAMTKSRLYKNSNVIYMWMYIGNSQQFHRKCYVGQAKDLNERTNDHIQEAFAQPSGCRKLNWAIRKSSPRDWLIIVLENVENATMMNEREKFYIRHHNTKAEGFNLK